MALFATSIVVTISVMPAVAQDKVWTGSVDSNFTTNGNWIGGIPGSADRALYDVSSGGTSANSSVNTSINIDWILLQGGYAGTVTNTAAGTINFTSLISISSGQFQSSGTLTGTGALTVSGTTVTLGGTSNYSGETLVSGGGTLKANSTTGFSQNSHFIINGGTLDLNGFNNAVGSIFDSAGGFGPSGLITNSGAVQATLTVGSTNFLTTFNRVIQDGSGGLALTVTGNNYFLSLGAANTYSGGTTISAGTTLNASHAT